MPISRGAEIAIGVDGANSVAQFRGERKQVSLDLLDLDTVALRLQCLKGGPRLAGGRHELPRVETLLARVAEHRYLTTTFVAKCK